MILVGKALPRTWKFFVHHLLVRRAVPHAEAVELRRQRQALLGGKTITVSTLGVAFQQLTIGKP